MVENDVAAASTASAIWKQREMHGWLSPIQNCHPWMVPSMFRVGLPILHLTQSRDWLIVVPRDLPPGF